MRFEVEMLRSDDKSKMSGNETGEASEPGAQDIVRVLPPTPMPPIGRGGPNQLRAITREGGPNEGGGARGNNNSLRLPSGIYAPSDESLSAVNSASRSSGTSFPGLERYFWARQRRCLQRFGLLIANERRISPVCIMINNIFGREKDR